MILSSLGIDLGGTKICFGILTEDGQLTETDTYAVDEMLYQKEPEKAFLNHLTQYLTQKEIQQKYKLQNIGIGLPGIVDHESGEVIYSSTFHWNHVPLGKIVTNATGVQCFVENDANCAALGEVRFGSAKGKENAVMITLGTGVGCGIIIQGNIFAGVKSQGAEFGHTTFIYGGLPCKCGRSGCIELYTSGSALQRMARESAVKYPHSLLASYPIEDITGRTPFQLYDRDPVSKNVIDLYLKYVGELMVNVTNIFRSEAIIIGGGVSEQGSVIKDYVSAYIKNNAYGQENAFQPEILIATLKNKAGLLGAASMNQ